MTRGFLLNGLLNSLNLSGRRCLEPVGMLEYTTVSGTIDWVRTFLSPIHQKERSQGHTSCFPIVLRPVNLRWTWDSVSHVKGLTLAVFNTIGYRGWLPALFQPDKDRKTPFVWCYNDRFSNQLLKQYAVPLTDLAKTFFFLLEQMTSTCFSEN